MPAYVWLVTLLVRPTEFPWKSDYFPRSFRYKKDALQLASTVEDMGGKAKVEKTKR